MSKKLKLFVCGSACVLSLAGGYVLTKSIIEYNMTNDVVAYYDKNNHTPSEIQRIKDTAWDDEVLTADDLASDYAIPTGYKITNIEETDNPHYVNVSYINTEDVIDLKDNSPFGFPLEHFSQKYVEIAKRKYSK